MWAVEELEVRPLREPDPREVSNYANLADAEFLVQGALRLGKGHGWGVTLDRAWERDTLVMTVWHYGSVGRHYYARQEITKTLWYNAKYDRRELALQVLKECVRQIEAAEEKEVLDGINGNQDHGCIEWRGERS